MWYNGSPLLSWGGGTADKSTGRIPDPHKDLFRIASNTKIFVSLLAEVFASPKYNFMRMDDAVNKYAPAFQPLNTFDDDPITFRMLGALPT